MPFPLTTPTGQCGSREPGFEVGSPQRVGPLKSEAQCHAVPALGRSPDCLPNRVAGGRLLLARLLHKRIYGTRGLQPG
jgi:hypothetical protein